VDSSVDADYHEDYHYPYSGDNDNTESVNNSVVTPLKLHRRA